MSNLTEKESYAAVLRAIEQHEDHRLAWGERRTDEGLYCAIGVYAEKVCGGPRETTDLDYRAFHAIITENNRLYDSPETRYDRVVAWLKARVSGDIR